MSQISRYFEATYPRRLADLALQIKTSNGGSEEIYQELRKFLDNTGLHLSAMKGTHQDVVDYSDRVTLEYIVRALQGMRLRLDFLETLKEN